MTGTFEFQQGEPGREPYAGFRGAPETELIARLQRRITIVISAAEVAQCTCPDFCQRDHEHE